MNRMFKLIKSNYRKDRKQLIPFFLILLFSSILLYIGLRMMDYEDLYNECEKAFRTPDLYYQEIGDLQSLRDNVTANDYIGEIVHEEALTGNAEFKNPKNGHTEVINITMSKYDEKRVLDFHMAEQSGASYENGIYVTQYLRTELGLALGDEIEVKLGACKARTYRVEGIYESLYLNSYFTGCGCMVKEDAYDSLAEELLPDGMANWEGIAPVLNTYINFKPGISMSKGFSRYTKEVAAYTSDLGGSGWGATREQAKTAILIVPKIIAAVCCCVAVIAAAISIVVAGFVIDNNIKRDIKNVGALKALGYTSGMLRASIVLEFALVALLAGGIGIWAANLIFPSMEMVARPMVGLVLSGAVVISDVGVTLLFLVGLAVIVTLIATARLVKIKPMIALRFGLESHSFKKNPIPLESQRGNINVLLAMKNMLQSTGHNVVLALVSTAVSFVMLFSLVLYYNSSVDITAFMRLLAGDSPDILVTVPDALCTSRESVEKLEKELLSVEGVEKVNRADFVYSTTNDAASTIIACDHVEDMDCGLCEGSMPQRDNEVVLGTLLAKTEGIKVGDEVTVAIGAADKKFIVSGLQQCFYGMGTRVYMSADALESMGQSLDSNMFRVKVKNPSAKHVEETIEEIKKQLGDRVVEIYNNYEEDHGDGNLPIVAIRYVTLVMVAINLLICFLVINIMIKAEITNKQKEYGIKKAMGFTSGQLRLQLALSIIPVMVLGTVLGSALSYLYGNGLAAVLCGSFGIIDIGFIHVPVMILISVAIITVYTFLLAFAMSAKIKKITAYQLITE